MTKLLLIEHDDGVDRVTPNPGMIDALEGIRAFLEKRKPVYIRR